MFKNYIIPALAIFGFFMGIKTIISSNKTPPVVQPLVQPAAAPFAQFVAGSGIVESASENIAIAAPVGGVVERVNVSVGARVKAGDPLFSLDKRELSSRRDIQAARLEVTKQELADLSEQFRLWSSIRDKRAVSEEEYIKRKNAVLVTTERVKLVESELAATEVDLERFTVRSPIDAQVLQVKIRVGEFAPAQMISNPVILLGATDVLHVRVDIDENDAWRVKNGAKGQAFLRGNTKLSTPIEFVRFEPYVVPKRSLTGESSERVDTRVLQVIYRFSPQNIPVFVGQLMDVFIEE
jgi:HlyD family secretion protein